MKYLNTFEENAIQLNLWDDLPIKYKNETVFHNNNWLVIKPASYETLSELSEGTEWGISNIYKNYHSTNNFKPTQYTMNDDIYVNINKKNNDKILFDFYRNDFIDKDEEQVYLKEFFDVNNDLFKFYGEIIECSNIVKDGNDYWIVVDEHEWFSYYYEKDSNTRNDFIEKILNGDSYEMFQYFGDVDLNEYGVELDDNSLILIKTILLFEKDVDYDEIIDIKDYDDVISIVKEYDIHNLKDLLIRCITDGRQSADESKAFEEVTDAYYDFFGLVVGTAKWDYYKDIKKQIGIGTAYTKKQKLFIKIKSNEDAYYAKFRINEYDDSYNDMIEYSPPYYGYSGDVSVMNEVLNVELFERFDEYITNKEIPEYYEIWKDLKQKGKSEEDIIDEIKFKIETKKYNL